MSHITVLETEAVTSLALEPGAVIVDATLGSGGHARAILAELDADSVFIGIDRDPTAIAAFRDSLSEIKVAATVLLVEANFAELPAVLETHHIAAADVILADLGWRMEQFDGSSGLPRGFSFQVDEPLLMTYGDPASYPFTAADIVNDWHEEDIANIIYAYGEERQARRIATFIVKARSQEPIDTAQALAAIVDEAIPKRFQQKRIHPATKTFQALRIAVNDELETLRRFVQSVPDCLHSGGRCSIITFHSIEDRVVKHSFRSLSHDHIVSIINKKPIIASAEERETNPRARSAKLRTIEKI